MTVLQTGALPLGYHAILNYIQILHNDAKFSDSYGNRTRVTAVKGRCLDRLTKEPKASLRESSENATHFLSLYELTPPVGLEPTTP